MRSSIRKYNPQEIEKKWQKKWEKNKLYSPNLDSSKKPFFNLMMFPYPSAEGLHVGNMYAFTGSDIYGRFMRMKGFDVFEPIGLDGFGIHSENYAIKVNRHPKEQAKKSQENFYRQLHATGNAYDWTRTLETYDPNYYKWTQWIFVQLFKKGVAYRKKSPVNFCPEDKTVLADEQVIDGRCERDGALVEKRDLEQWFFKITDYADRLLSGLNKINWSEKVKIAQRQWIGKKEGINIRYKIVGKDQEIVCWTSRPDTNFGATFIVLAPENPQVLKLTIAERKKAVEQYIKRSQMKGDKERIAEGREKSGVFTGSYAINDLTGEKMPIWVSDFVLMEFGTGVVVGVPGHDKRDFQFAKKFKLSIKRVVVGRDGDTSEIRRVEQVQEEEGTMINSEFLNGLDIHKATIKIMDYLEEKGWGKRVTTYHLRDWLISRQRYWGPPIPMIFCKKCASAGGSAQAGWQPVPEKDLPVLLPEVKDWKPMGIHSTSSGQAVKSPLASIESFVNTTCPNCKGEAKRETDVSDTFLDSAWYFFRYISVEDKNQPFDKLRARKWLPVHMYIGGAEHSVLHLLYSRFLTMFFKDLGLISFEEPFTRFYAHGLLIKEGAKMSKSKGNIVVPDAYIREYGADTLRTYLMFLGPFNQGGDFYDSGIEGVHKFIKRVWNAVLKARVRLRAERDRGGETLTSERLRMMHKTVKKVTADMENLRYNTAIAALMGWYNFLAKQKSLSKIEAETFLKLLAPFAPHMAEELWEIIARGPATRFPPASARSATLKSNSLRAVGIPSSRVTPRSIHLESWPVYDEKHLKENELIIVVQVNGKLRDTIKIQNAKVKDQKYVGERAKESSKVKKYLEGKKVRKVVYVEGKIINFVA